MAHTFHDVRLKVYSPKGELVLLQPRTSTQALTALLRRNGLPLNTRCGERGLCDGCLVELVEGELTHTPTQAVVRVSAGGTPVTVRACHHRPSVDAGDVVLRIPARSLLAHEPKVLAEFKVNVPFAHQPMLPGAESGVRALGVAVDIGTTTVAVLLIDLADGQVVAQASGFNHQMHLGDDVVTRINLCMADPTMLGQLQEQVVKHTLAPLTAQALRHYQHEHPGQAVRVTGFVLAGNTTMLHILAGVDPASLGVAPFTPVFLEHRQLTSGDIGLHVPESADGAVPVHLLPGAAAYIGADLVAGILASGLAYDDGPSLLVDVGTNGEIILKHGGKMLGCATAAGPAFEGARLASGIRAGRGAISMIRLQADPFAIHTEVIGRDHAIGLCGSAYIDFLAQARLVNLIGPSGRLTPEDCPGARPHLVGNEGHASALRIAAGRGGQDILVTETDLASLLQAKAAIAAGIVTLLNHAGLKPEDVQRLYLAGGFGTHMDHANAIACGLLPGFAPGQVQVVGNSSLAGAYLAAVDGSALAEMNRLARAIEIVELNLVPGFEDCYIEQLMLP